MLRQTCTSCLFGNPLLNNTKSCTIIVQALKGISYARHTGAGGEEGPPSEGDLAELGKAMER